MTAEEKLKEIKDTCMWTSGSYTHKDSDGRIYISAEDIDLIANLVIERLREETK